MAWVPTTDAQARVYFYNIYTRETSWVPPPGAPRIELEHWEKTYAARKAKNSASKSLLGLSVDNQNGGSNGRRADVLL
jgi:hypothetical protein